MGKKALFSVNKGSSLPYNTIIGGQGAITTTAADLETLLGLSVGDVTYFNLNGNDIEAFINTTYILSSAVFNGNSSITSFLDLEDNCTDLSSQQTFNNTANLNSVKLNGITVGVNHSQFANSGIVSVESNLTDFSVNGNGFEDSFSLTDVTLPNFLTGSFQDFRDSGCAVFDFPLLTELRGFSATGAARVFYNCTNATLVNIPLCDNMGSPSIDNQNFFNIPSGCVINVHSSLETANGGNPDEDLVYAASQGAIINYI